MLMIVVHSRVLIDCQIKSVVFMGIEKYEPCLFFFCMLILIQFCTLQTLLSWALHWKGSSISITAVLLFDHYTHKTCCSNIKMVLIFNSPVFLFSWFYACFLRNVSFRVKAFISKSTTYPRALTKSFDAQFFKDFCARKMWCNCTNREMFPNCKYIMVDLLASVPDMFKWEM